MTEIIEIEKESLPQCMTCGDRKVVRGAYQKKGKKRIVSYYCHGEEDIYELTEGKEGPEKVFKFKDHGKTTSKKAGK